MDSTAIGTAASLVTLVIVAVTAFAALRQMRHNQMANELELHLHFVTEVNSPQMLEAIGWVLGLSDRMKDRAFRDLLEREPQNEQFRDFVVVTRFFERYASLIIVSGLSEHLIMFEYSSLITSVWDNVYEAVGILRADGYRGRSFEHLAMRARRYSDVVLPREYAHLLRDPRLAGPTEHG